MKVDPITTETSISNLKAAQLNVSGKSTLNQLTSTGGAQFTNMVDMVAPDSILPGSVTVHVPLIAEGDATFKNDVSVLKGTETVFDVSNTTGATTIKKLICGNMDIGTLNVTKEIVAPKITSSTLNTLDLEVNSIKVNTKIEIAAGATQVQYFDRTTENVIDTQTDKNFLNLVPKITTVGSSQEGDAGIVAIDSYTPLYHPGLGTVTFKGTSTTNGKLVLSAAPMVANYRTSEYGVGSYNENLTYAKMPFLLIRGASREASPGVAAADFNGIYAVNCLAAGANTEIFLTTKATPPSSATIARDEINWLDYCPFLHAITWGSKAGDSLDFKQDITFPDATLTLVRLSYTEFTSISDKSLTPSITTASHTTGFIEFCGVDGYGSNTTKEYSSYTSMKRALACGASRAVDIVKFDSAPVKIQKYITKEVTIIEGTYTGTLYIAKSSKIFPYPVAGAAVPQAASTIRIFNRQSAGGSSWKITFEDPSSRFVSGDSDIAGIDLKAGQSITITRVGLNSYTIGN